VQAPQPPADLPVADVQAFSIDDSATTEIDDALSVTGLGTGTVTVGIHIAAPGLAITPGGELDKLGRARLSTVYMPGYKITMLPDDVVHIYTLDEGRSNPAVSLYVQINEETLETISSETRLERVPVEVNFRYDKLDHIVTEEWLTDSSIEVENTPDSLLGKRKELTFLQRWSKFLKANREVVRGKPENFNRPDYNFRLVGNDGAEPNGSEQVQITVRKRGAPLDLIVAEAAIVANSTWGLMLAEHGVPGIYRSQASLAPGVKVRMSTKALPHAGIGVKAYSWATSRCAAMWIWSISGRSLPAPATARRPPWPRPSSPRMPSCSASSAALTAPTAPTTAIRPAWSASGRSSIWSRTASPS
jgi:exoribonuclease-2